eukprot:scaffold2125_cov79-Skeletonema_dohrnii-CCMP3373.AAC.2
MIHSSLLSNYCIHHPLTALIRIHSTVKSCGETVTVLMSMSVSVENAVLRSFSFSTVSEHLYLSDARRAIDLNPDDVIDQLPDKLTVPST